MSNSVNIAVTVEFKTNKEKMTAVKTKAVYQYCIESHSVNIAELRPEQYMNTEYVPNLYI